MDLYSCNNYSNEFNKKDRMLNFLSTGFRLSMKKDAMFIVFEDR